MDGKIEANKNTPEPRKQAELQFMPNMAHIIVPLTNMLKKEFNSGRQKVKGKAFKQQSDPKFLWSEAQTTAFEKSKQMLRSDLLIHYDSTKEVILETLPTKLPHYMTCTVLRAT